MVWVVVGGSGGGRSCICMYMYVYVCICMYLYMTIPVVPHEAVPEVSKKGKVNNKSTENVP